MQAARLAGSRRYDCPNGFDGDERKVKPIVRARRIPKQEIIKRIKINNL